MIAHDAGLERNRIFFATKGGRIGTVDASTGVSQDQVLPR